MTGWSGFIVGPPPAFKLREIHNFHCVEHVDMSDYTRIASLVTMDDFEDHLEELGVSLPCRELGDPSSLAVASDLETEAGTVGNRFALQPMEGWDGTEDGKPGEKTTRRWRRFGLSGAKLIWGGEAIAVRPDARANPNQLMLTPDTQDALSDLFDTLISSHEEHIGSTDDLVVGLQLTHSGRYCTPEEKGNPEPKIVYRHPILDRKEGIESDDPVLTDDEIREIIADFVRAGEQAEEIGADFVDIKHCHGYLGHEFLSARDREGPYGGSFENRTRFLREIVEGIRDRTSDLSIGVRFSAFDLIPFKPENEGAAPRDLGPGEPESYEDLLPYRWGFGVDEEEPVRYDLSEPRRFLSHLEELDIELVNLSAGSPYYNPHIQRPALFPPSDGYQPPEDPLVGVARQINVVHQLKQDFPDLVMMGSGYSYLQEYLPNVAEGVIEDGFADLIGLGRMTLTYPDLPADVLAGEDLVRKKICRTFSDCTTAPRHGMESGCYPLDDYYKDSEQGEKLREIKQGEE